MSFKANTLAVEAGVEAMLASGVTCVVAGGNESEDACGIIPARVPGALTVAASDAFKNLAGFSNRGPCIDLIAPGHDITSAGATSDTATAVKSGTSMAAPHVAGAAALYLEAHPAATPADVHFGIVNDATPGVVYGVPVGTPNRLLYTLGSCGNYVCDPWEGCSVCGSDCGCCGDGVCQPGETPESCGADCQGWCGDGYCNEVDQECLWCTQDCPSAPVCGPL
jgi:subtilisin family serine protease